MKKNYMVILFITILALVCFAGCGKAKTKKESKSEKIKVVTTVFAEYDWVKQIAGAKVSDMDLTMLLDNGIDLHSYQPTTEDIRKISECDLFIYVGGESDKWVQNALKNPSNKKRKVINLLDILGNSVKEEEVKEGMEVSEEEEDEEKEEGPEYDEHVWLSLKNAKILCQEITKELVQIDKNNASFYQKNQKAYEQKLDQLDQDYQKAVDKGTCKTLLFGDRFPFRYLVDDYHLDYYAAFVGCSAETEASFKTISFLAQKMDQLKLKNVMTIEKSDKKIAQTIIDNTKKKDQKILEMDSMQSTTSEDVANGVTYLTVMQKNLDTLKKALQ